jgi:hypothetical protein
MDGQMPFEEWIYGTPPQEVDFVRINGNRVIRLEVARDGEALQIFTKDVVSAMMTTDSTPVITANTRTIHEGDVDTDPNRQAPIAPPSLRKPGETTATDSNNPSGGPNVGVMRPVQFPKPHTDQQPGSNPDEQPSAPAAAGQPAPSSYPQPAAQGNAQSPPASRSEPQSPPANKPPAPAGSPQPPASTSQLVPSGSSSQPN